MTIRNQKDFWAGVMFVVIGVLFLFWSQAYQFGTASRMGPGYFPTVLGGLQIALGILVAWPALGRSSPIVKVDSIGWRGLGIILGAVILYAVLLPRLGFVISLVVLIVVSAMGTREFRPVETLISTVVLGIVSYLVFVKGLELQFPVWPPFLTR